MYKLTVTETNNKACKYIYRVVDADNAVLTERRSNRVYVACTLNGAFFFGRLDLIGKGDHGRTIKALSANTKITAAGKDYLVQLQTIVTL